MKTIKNYWKKIRMNFYSFMMTICAEYSEMARVEHGEESIENIRWVRSYDKFSKKYEKILSSLS